MRFDTTGIFWDDYIPPKVKKEKIKREPPEPTWLEPDYLPGLEEARAFVFNLMTEAELITAKAAKDAFVWDIEAYLNYFLVGFKHLKTGKLIMFEAYRDEPLTQVQKDKLRWVLSNCFIIGFNDNNFDIPLVTAILEGFSTDKVMACVRDLIEGRPEQGIPPMKPWIFYRAHKLKSMSVNNIDLIELTPGGKGLKICAGRIGARRMADLPFKPGTNLSDDQITILRYYWTNDLDNTAELYEKHKTAIALREILTEEYGVDVRSKSDPQVAEEIIRSEIKRITGRRFIEKAEIEPGRQFGFTPPPYIEFKTENMRWVLDMVRRVKFTVDNAGGVMEADELAGLAVPIGDMLYTMGVGGLHSKEKKCQHVSDEHWELTDNDVTSYYPALIIQQGMYPPNVGPVFLQVFERIFRRRLAAKASGDKATAETLKIVLNGTFGKTGERGGHSVVYYPEMMIQVTLSGQLSLMMLIERLELAGIHVVSANTDGIMVKCPRHLIPLKQQIMEQWQTDTGLGLESVGYKAVYSRDVNNYVALYSEVKEVKDGFSYAKSIGAFRKVIDAYPLKWNPVCEISKEAAIAYLGAGVPVEETIKGCTDVRKFIEVRAVNAGGAWKDGEYLGKAIRWYYRQNDSEPIINAKTGNMVPRSMGGHPCMTMPKAIPDDLDYDAYIQRAYEMLENLSVETSTPN